MTNRVWNGDAVADLLPRPTGLTGTPDHAGLRSMQQLIQLRWIATVGQVAAILVVHYAYGITLPLQAMFAVLGVLVVFNLLSLAWWHGRSRITGVALLVALLVDVASLTAQLHLSGGLSNPFLFLYLLQVALGAVLLRSPYTWLVAAATALGVVLLVMFPGPTRVPVDPADGLADPYVQGLLVCFLLMAALLVVFVARIERILRERAARLAALRQRAVEEEHIVRMGLLATGAAHELGTPLSTLAVILRDWQHLPLFAADPELREDVAEMEAQVLRCKAIVTNILLSAGEMRGEAPRETTLHAFLDDLAAEWRSSRPVRRFEYRNGCEQDPPLVSDPGLRQMVFNVLDNALEASPQHVALDVACRDSDLVIEIADSGGGFDAAILERLGTPYNSSKGEPGRGLGLFLSVNVARTLGGRLSARNRPQGGAVVTMVLPLSALALEEQDTDDE
ncbi:HAMP domain-containing histidine kinase [Luteimonas yindakuii]|uniref:ATP-binding protein n=1 Tax=Luteimonas yindakuii TaxID=2565782 RepID=UPI001107809E|nr:ATP-binding protein [Luteimonas yindakuii]QCO68125.2 HAMP domain-containing histidine kinase [Luteimonas yindakuii]